MFSKFGQIMQSMINIKSLPVSIAIVLIFASLRYYYKKSKFVKGLIHQISTNVNQSSQENVGTSKYWIFFFYYFMIISLNGLLGALGIGDLFGHYDISYINPKLTPFFFILPAIIFAVYKSIRHKGIRAITDLTERELPLPVRIIIFPIELAMVLIKSLVLPFRLAIHAYISHEIMHSLLRMIVDQLNEGDPSSSLIFSIAILIKMMEIMSSVIQALIFTINMSILFGKFYKEEH